MFYKAEPRNAGNEGYVNLSASDLLGVIPQEGSTSRWVLTSMRDLVATILISGTREECEAELQRVMTYLDVIPQKLERNKV